MAKRDKPTPINREKFLKNLPDPYQIPEQDLQPYDNSNPNAKYRNPGEPEFVRGNEISMDGDTNNTINISLEDHDETILYYLENHIKPTVEINGNQTKVPIIYGSPERWKSMQRDGFFRDKNGKAFIPIIAIKRESFEKDRRLGNKLDGNKVQNVQYFKTGYSKRNLYDNFSILQNQKPSEEYQVGVIPDYITITYKLSIFTDYVEHMNSIIEAIEFASDSYWGDKERFQFRASITSYPTPTEVENGNDRAVKSELTLVVNGYIIPKTINVQKAAPSPKSYNVTKLLFKEFTEDTTSPKLDKEGNKIITFTNPGENRVAYYGTFNGNFIGDGSQLTNLPVQDIDTGSFVLTGSYNQDSSSFDNRINNINFDTSSLLLTSSFNNFTSSYNTSSFTGSFVGDGSQLINLPIQYIDTGSLVTTSSFNNFTSSYQNDSSSFDDRINNLPISQLIREEFIYISGNQIFTLNNNYAQVYSIEVQGQGALSTSQYTLNGGNSFTINDILEENDYIVVLYSDLNTGVLPYYTQVQSDSFLSLKADLVGGKVPSSQLPSYVDDVEEYANLASFPVTGEMGKIYLALDTNKTYRWSGSVYVQIGGGKKTHVIKIAGVISSGETRWLKSNAYDSFVQATNSTDVTAGFASDNLSISSHAIPFNHKIVGCFFNCFNNVGGTTNLDVAVVSFEFPNGGNNGIALRTNSALLARKNITLGSSISSNFKFTGSEVNSVYNGNENALVKLYIKNLSAPTVVLTNFQYCLTLLVEEI